MNAISQLPALTSAQVDAQSLASGAVGTALLAVEQALNGVGAWATAHQAIKQVTAGPVDAGDHAGLFYGAPAVAFLLHAATADGIERYPAARQTLDRYLRQLTRRRLAAAAARIRASRSATFAEYDLFYGLVGHGVVLLHQHPGSDELGDVLRHLVQLTKPRDCDGLRVPGWWVDHDPDPTLPTPGGHANAGMAHGAAGILALLAHATRHGSTVPGQAEAIDRLCAWFDQWQQTSPHGPWWPQWITRDQLHSGRTTQDGPGRPSWCYGAAGIARAQQLAAIATGDATRQHMAEDALASALTGPQVDLLTDLGLCHGLAGLYQTTYRAAADATSPTLARRLPTLATRLSSIGDRAGRDDEHGILTGRTGVALVAGTIHAGQPPHTRWDTCLLIT